MRIASSVLIGALVLAGCGGTASTGKPTTQPPASVASASPTPVAPSTVPALHDGPLHGTYSFLNGVGTVEVPAGWAGCCDAYAILKSDFAALLLDDITEVIVYADSCHWQAGPNPEPKGAQAAAMAFAAQRGHQGTQPEATTIAGLPGWHVRLTVPANQPTTGGEDDRRFTGCDNGKFASWGLKSGGGEPNRFQQGPSQIDDLYIVDVGSRTIVLDMVSGPGIAASDQAELDAMLASIRFP